MTKADYHVHTTFCDGKNTPEEMARAALEMGLANLGFSGHSYTWFDESYCMSKDGTKAYKAEIIRLKSACRDRIRIFCGIEQDYYSEMPTEGYDYVIGSVHYLKFGDRFVPMDEGNKNLIEAANAFCGGDVLRVLELYYETVADVVNRTHCDIIGHFDLPTKYFEKDPIADTNHPRYKRAWMTAADALLKTDALFELNTGAISRGCRTKQYPADEILSYLGERKAKVVLSGDCHRSDAICFGFDELIQKCEYYGLEITEPAFTKKTGFS